MYMHMYMYCETESMGSIGMECICMEVWAESKLMSRDVNGAVMHLFFQIGYEYKQIGLQV